MAAPGRTYHRGISVRYAELLLSLLPPISYSPAGENIRGEIQAEANALERVGAGARQALAAISPISAVDTLPDWERVCGLSASNGMNRQQRLDAVLAKLQELGGLSIPYFKSLARRLGYEIEITEFEPFYLDYSLLDRDILYLDDVIWIWQVSVKSGLVRSLPFTLDSSSVDESLLAFADAIIEAYFRELRPAHTYVTFEYLEQSA